MQCTDGWCELASTDQDKKNRSFTPQCSVLISFKWLLGKLKTIFLQTYVKKASAEVRSAAAGREDKKVEKQEKQQFVR